MSMNLTRNILLIDTSCYIFACYTGLVSWYKNELGQCIDHDNIMENKEFISKYTEMFKNMLLKFKRKYNIPNLNIILAKDCSRSNIWRKDIFPEYKKNRDDRTMSKFNSCIFKYTYVEIIDSLKQTIGFKVVDMDRAEADDIIAMMTDAIHTLSPDTNVYIVSNDNDYIQLVGRNTHVIDMKCEPLNNRVCHSPQDYLMAKIIMGDKSDNIPPIAKRIGKKRATALVHNPNELDKLLMNDQIRCQFELNRQLIDFSNIPCHLRQGIQSKLKEMTFPNRTPTFRHLHNQYHHHSGGVIAVKSGERW